MKLTPIVIGIQLQVAADATYGFALPRAGTIVGIDSYCTVYTGTPTNIKLDLNVGGSEAVADFVTHTEVGLQSYRCVGLGGANANVAVAKDALVTVDLKFTAGSTPKYSGSLVFWVDMGEV